MCAFPPVCRWEYNEAGEARLECTAPPHETPILVAPIGVMCPHQLHILAYLWVPLSTLVSASNRLCFVVTVQALAMYALPRVMKEQLRIPWTRACSYAFALALIVSISLRTRISCETVQ